VRRTRVLPGFRLSLGFSLVYLGVVALLPLSTLVLRATRMTWPAFVASVTSERVVAALRLSFGAGVAAALLNAAFGMVVAWVLVRYRSPGRGLADALVDVPLALPTSVAGIALTTLYAKSGWFGRYLEPWGLKVAFAPLGVVVALTFIGLPFVVRSLQPVLSELDPDLEEAAASLGATHAQTFRRVTLPQLYPAWLTGTTLAFARAVGEYGSVVFISGNLPFKTEIAPFLIMARLEQYDYLGATAIAVVMLALSFVILGTVNAVQWWQVRRAVRA
jgi:sulfate/thiosulfate transport system permease protein